jgi:hypothetical protein
MIVKLSVVGILGLSPNKTAITRFRQIYCVRVMFDIFRVIEIKFS